MLFFIVIRFILILTIATTNSLYSMCNPSQWYITSFVNYLLGTKEEGKQATNTVLNQGSIKKGVFTESEARREWFKRYPCASGEESDCYYPYFRDSYKQAIKKDNKKRKAFQDDDY